MQFLCDQMLVRLGRWLRAAGYDTEIIEKPMPDREILKKAIDEKRLLITRDKHFLEFKDGGNQVIWLKSNDLESWVTELKKYSPINWLYNPFTRCLLCNSDLLILTENQLDEVPEKVLLAHQKFWRCSNCHKIYWFGSHTDRMEAKLKCWQEHSRNMG